MFDDPFFTSPFDPFAMMPHHSGWQQSGPLSGVFNRSPQMQMSEEEHRFIVRAEVPGVPKENLDVSIGDDGQSLTIKGSTFSSYEDGGYPQPQRTGGQSAPAAGETRLVRYSNEGQHHIASLETDSVMLTRHSFGQDNLSGNLRLAG